MGTGENRGDRLFLEDEDNRRLKEVITGVLGDGFELEGDALGW